jgi:hypothetical protein
MMKGIFGILVIGFVLSALYLTNTYGGQCEAVKYKIKERFSEAMVVTVQKHPAVAIIIGGVIVLGNDKSLNDAIGQEVSTAALEGLLGSLSQDKSPQQLYAELSEPSMAVKALCNPIFWYLDLGHDSATGRMVAGIERHFSLGTGT